MAAGSARTWYRRLRLMLTKQKRVWILGAGFSQPLGGPLLTQLFAERQLHLAIGDDCIAPS